METGYFISMQRSWLRLDDGDGQQNIGTEDYVFIYERVDGEWVFTEFPIIR